MSKIHQLLSVALINALKQNNNKKMYKLVIFTLLAALSVASASFWTPCGGTATTHFVQSSVCDDTRCRATRGQPMIANTTISFANAHQRLDIRVRTIFLGVTIIFPLGPPDDDACNGLTFDTGARASCPVIPGHRYQWVMSVDVPTNIPAIQNNLILSEFLNNFNWNYFLLIN